MRGVHRERHQHGEDLGGEHLGESRPLGLREVVEGDDVDARLGEGRTDALVEDRGVLHLQHVGGGVDVAEHLPGRGADVRRHRQPGQDAALQARDADHEELVEVGGEDRQEVGAFEHRQGVVLGEVEHAAVEGQPAQLAVEEPVRRQVAAVRRDPGWIEVVVQHVRERSAPLHDTVRVHVVILPPGGLRANERPPRAQAARGAVVPLTERNQAFEAGSQLSTMAIA